MMSRVSDRRAAAAPGSGPSCGGSCALLTVDIGRGVTESVFALALARESLCAPRAR